MPLVFGRRGGIYVRKALNPLPHTYKRCGSRLAYLLVASKQRRRQEFTLLKAIARFPFANTKIKDNLMNIRIRRSVFFSPGQNALRGAS
jgi:hypothetical protein